MVYVQHLMERSFVYRGHNTVKIVCLGHEGLHDPVVA
jgi:hypothetical protein